MWCYESVSLLFAVSTLNAIVPICRLVSRQSGQFGIRDAYSKAHSAALHISARGARTNHLLRTLWNREELSGQQTGRVHGAKRRKAT